MGLAPTGKRRLSRRTQKPDVSSWHRAGALNGQLIDQNGGKEIPTDPRPYRHALCGFSAQIGEQKQQKAVTLVLHCYASFGFPFTARCSGDIDDETHSPGCFSCRRSRHTLSSGHQIIPKEMLTVVDRPVLQNVVDEAREAGKVS